MSLKMKNCTRVNHQPTIHPRKNYVNLKKTQKKNEFTKKIIHIPNLAGTNYKIWQKLKSRRRKKV